jgi:hypothetical protein
MEAYKQFCECGHIKYLHCLFGESLCTFGYGTNDRCKCILFNENSEEERK